MAVMSQPKREKLEKRERASATVPTQKWWTGVLFWTALTVFVGVAYRFVVPAETDGSMDRVALFRFMSAALLNTLVMYWVCYFAARQTLSRRPIKEIWQSPRNQDAINRFGLPLLLTIFGFAVIALTGMFSVSLFTGLVTTSTLFCIYRAITTAYTSHYFDYVAAPVELKEFEDNKYIKSKKRRVAERLAVSVGLRYPRHRLALPLFQTVLIAFLPQSVFTLVIMLLGGNQETLSANWILTIAPALPVLAVVAWSFWHLQGGAGKIFRLGEGRSMKSFGWSHPEFSDTRK